MKRPPGIRPRKTTLLKLGVFVLLGAVVNVAVAWGCAIWSTTQEKPNGSTQRFDAVPSEFEELVRPEWLDAPPSYPSSLEPGISLRVRSRTSWGWSCRRLEIWWLIAGSDSMSPDFSIYLVTAGWPIRTVSCHGFAHPDEILRASIRRGDWTSAIEPCAALHAQNMGPWGDEQFARPLPFRPILFGFAINTIFYAAILWLLWIAPGRIKRFVRIRRHCCPACGYIIARDTCANGLCSECGAALPRVLQPHQALSPGSSLSLLT